MGFKRQLRVKWLVAAFDTLPPASVRLHLVIEPFISSFKKAVGSFAVFKCADIWTQVPIDMFSVLGLAAYPDIRKKLTNILPGMRIANGNNHEAQRAFKRFSVLGFLRNRRGSELSGFIG